MNRLTLPRLGTTIKLLLIANIGVYFFEILPGIGDFLIDWGSLVPHNTFRMGQVWRLATYMFLHDPVSPFHLLFNMLALWMFGMEIEDLWGSRKIAFFYLLSGVGSGFFSVIHLFFPAMSATGVIGASGAVLALMTVYAVYYPHRQILLFFILPVNIRVVIVGYALISLFGSIAPRGVVAHLTHLGGILVAIGYLKWYPLMRGLFNSIKDSRKERWTRKRVEKAFARKRFFEEQIDPILEKISREGIDSLTTEERKLLEKIAASDRSDAIKKGKIIPFDAFR